MPFPVKHEFIRRAEEALGAAFPPSYAGLLLESNGGEFDVEDESWQFFPVFDDSDRKRAGRTAGHLVRENAEARAWEGFPADGVAVAANGEGDFLLFLPGVSPDRLGEAVYLWHHETCEIFLVADDIKTLIPAL